MTSHTNSVHALKFATVISAAVLALLSINAAAHAGSCSKESGNADIPRHAVIAHRGASFWAPEETAPAYLLACALGADYLELDIQLSSDGVPVLFHDDTLERTTNVAEIFPERKSSPLNAFTIDEIKKLDAGSWFNVKNPDRARPAYVGEKIITLYEFVKLTSSCREPQRLYIESKNPEKNPGVEEKIVSILENAGLLDKSRIIFQSFNLGSLNRFRELAPEIPRVFLISQDMEKASGMQKLISDASEVAAGIGPVGYVAWPWNIRKAHKAGLIVHVYTINAPWQARLANCFGADGIFTDRSDMLLKMYKRGQKEKPEDTLKRLGY